MGFKRFTAALIVFVSIMTLSAIVFSTPAMAYDDVTISQNTILDAGEYHYNTLRVTGNSVLTLKSNPVLTGYKGATIYAENIIIDEGSSISTDSRGYPGGQGPGVGQTGRSDNNWWFYLSGAGYGGQGGNDGWPVAAGASYGSAMAPTDLGSGGSIAWGGDLGAGGGAVKIVVNTLTLNGKISANGSNWGVASAGSGGSIYVIANRFDGSGSFFADGGTGGYSNSRYFGAGGGGRIAVYYQSSTFRGKAEAKGGKEPSYAPAGDGTVVFVDQANGVLYTGRTFRFQENDGPFTYNRIVLDGSKVTNQGNINLDISVLSVTNSDLRFGGVSSTISADSFVPVGSGVILDGVSFSVGSAVTVDSSVIVLQNARLFKVPSLTLTHGSALKLAGQETLDIGDITLTDHSVINSTSGVRIDLSLNSLIVDASSAVSVDYSGYPGGQGPGVGQTGRSDNNWWFYLSGAGYGGQGGNDGWPVAAGASYGSAMAPTDLGSGGAIAWGGDPGAGGGAIKIVADVLTLDGKISANGSNWGAASAGSGGSIYIISSQLDGSGSLAADGGTGGYSNSRYFGAGGGGRIAVYYQSSSFTGTVEAKGGKEPSYAPAGDGTVVFVDQANGVLYTGRTFRFQENDGPFTYNEIVIGGSQVTTQGNINIDTNVLSVANSNLRLGGASSTISADSFVPVGSGVILDGVSFSVGSAVTVDSSVIVLQNARLFKVPSLTFSRGSALKLAGQENLDIDDIALTDHSVINCTQGVPVNLNLDNMIVDASSAVSVDYSGYPGGQGPGVGQTGRSDNNWWFYLSGAGYGGQGGNDGWPVAAGASYGSAQTPTDLGSGGAIAWGGNLGAGGGAVKIVANALTMNGKITANGSNWDAASAGSGGSIYIIANRLDGSGSFFADGGTGGYSNSRYFGAGGGGRIAIYYQTSGFTGAAEAKGGKEPYYAPAGDGTVVWGFSDSTPPTTDVNTNVPPEESGWYSSDVVVTLVASDPGGSGVLRIQYRLDGSDWRTFSSQFTISVEGIHLLEFRSLDKAGNTEDAKSVTIKIDKSAPVTQCDLEGTLGDDGWYVSDVKVTLSAIDAYSGVLRTEYSLDGETWTTYTEPFYVSSEGANTLYYRSVDKAGIDEVLIVPLHVSIDKTPPVTEPVVTGATSGEYYTSGVEVSLSTCGSGYTEYSYNDNDWNTYSEPLTFEDDGVYYVYIRSVDSAGNVEKPQCIVIMIDKTPPVITGHVTTSPNSNGWYRGDVTVHFEASDASTITYVTPDTVVTGEGDNLAVTGTATDAAGNTATYTVSGIKIDRTAPVVTASRTAANTNGWNNADVTVRFEASDSLSGLKSLPTEDIVVSAEGSNLQATRTAEDLAGNTAVATVDGINIDRTRPTLSYVRTPANLYGWNNRPVTVTFQSTDALSGLETVTDPVIIAGEGANQLAAGSATDKAGNTASLQVDNINIDLTAPAISGAATTAPNANGWYNADVTVHFAATDSLSGLATTTPDAVISTEGANQAATGTATDKAGNSASDTVGGINLDKTAPVLGTMNVPMEPALFNTAIAANVTYVEPNADKAVWSWGDGTPVTETSLAAISDSTARATHAYAKPGVYVVTVTVIDMAGNLGTATSSYYVVVYDPNGGFVTGGGWIDSPVGAYSADPTLAGKANFGFVSKYQKGANVPTGDTEFQFKAGNLNFKSTSYDWLVIAGAKAQFKGTGTINGTGSYRFILTSIDGDMLGKGKPDMFRIRIWDESSGGIIYDNQMNAPDSSDPTTVLGGGSVVVHKG